MHNALVLIKGEMQRLVKYKILQISFVVTVLWLALLFAIGKENAGMFVPIFIFTDAAFMTVLLVGASLFYEKQENTLKTLLITPSGFVAILLSKVVSAVYLALQSAVLISLAAYFFFDVSIHLLALYGYVVIIAFAHTAIGFSFAIYSRDFNGLIGCVGLYMILFAIPSVFYALGIIPEMWETILMVSPTHASYLMIHHSFQGEVRLWMLIGSIIYLLVIAGVLFIKVIGPKYHVTAVRE